MTRPIPIGCNAANELFYVSVSEIPHLFVSYFNTDQIRTFYSFLLNGKGKANADRPPMFGIAATTPTLRFHVTCRSNSVVSFIKDDEFGSSVSSKEEFLYFLSKELKRRHKLQLATNQNKVSIKKPLEPVIIIMDDVLDIVISHKKAIGLAFLQLLLLGNQVNMHVIAASSYTCRHLLRQLMNVNSLVRNKFKKFFNQDAITNPSIAELVFTSEDFVFFKKADERDYNRLYPLKATSII